MVLGDDIVNNECCKIGSNSELENLVPVSSTAKTNAVIITASKAS